MSMSTIPLVPSIYTDPGMADFDRLVDDALTRRLIGSNAAHWDRDGGDRAPRIGRLAVDLHEDMDKNVMNAMFELPGVRKEDVNIDVNNNLLTVSCEMKQTQERSEGGFLIRERRHGKCARSIPIPPGMKPEQIRASMDNGVLTVTCPRNTPEQTPRKVRIA